MGVRNLAGAGFRLGRVITTGCSVLGHEFVAFCVIYVLCGIPIIAGFFVIVGAVLLAGHDISTQTPLYVVLAAVAWFLESLLVQSAISFRTFRRLCGETVGIRRCIARALAVLPRVFGAMLLSYAGAVAVVLGAALIATIPMGGLFFLPSYTSTPSTGAAIGAFAIMLVGGALMILLTAILWVVVPVVVIERAGPIAALGRSYRLVSEHRWVVFALMLVLGIADTGLFPLEQRLLADTLGGIGQAATFNLLFVFITAANAVLATVGYHDLRAEKEGVGEGEVGHVFD